MPAWLDASSHRARIYQTGSIRRAMVKRGQFPMSKTFTASELSENPLTDPRSLGGSAAFHILLVILASLVVMPVALPLAGSTRPKALYAEIDPVDNRESVPFSPGEGGGGPGEIG